MLAFSPAGTVGDNVMKITSNTRRISINGVTLMSARGSILRRFFFIVSPNSECSRDSDRQDFVPEKLLIGVAEPACAAVMPGLQTIPHHRVRSGGRTTSLTISAFRGLYAITDPRGESILDTTNAISSALAYLRK